MKKLFLFLGLVLLVGACQKENLYHNLTVEGGIGSGTYELGSLVDFEANPAETGYVFSYWSGDTNHLTDAFLSTCRMTMPFQDVYLKANYENAPYYQLNVIRGTGSGMYQKGYVVDVISDPSTSDSGFFEWKGDIQYLEQPKSPVTTLTMPSANITIEAVYSALPKYPLIVQHGFGSGGYLAGTVVSISSDPPANKFFKEWTGDIQFLNDRMVENTEVSMPAQAVTITAEFEDAISFSSQVLPLILAECATSGCHDASSANEPLTNYQQVKQHDQDVRYRVNNGNMPPSKLLTNEQKQLIIKWVDQGSMNN